MKASLSQIISGSLRNRSQTRLLVDLFYLIFPFLWFAKIFFIVNKQTPYLSSFGYPTCPEVSPYESQQTQTHTCSKSSMSLPTTRGALVFSLFYNWLSNCFIEKKDIYPSESFLTFLSCIFLSDSCILFPIVLSFSISCSHTLSRSVCIKWNHRSDFHSQAPGLWGQFQLRSEGGGRLHESGILEPPGSL